MARQADLGFRVEACGPRGASRVLDMGGNNEATTPVPQQQVALQKELLVNTAVEDAPKTPALTDCADPLVPVQNYKAYHRVELQR